MFAVCSLRKIAYYLAIIACFIIGAGVIHTEEKGEEFVVIMYHSILKDTERTGRYVVRPDSLEADIKYLNSHGYKSVSAEEIINYSKGNGILPEKSYILTFDDGSYNNLVYLLPLLEKYDAYAIISIVGSYTEKFSELDEANAAYSYLRWCDIDELVKSGRVAIGNHSYDYHDIKNGRIGAKIGKYEDKEKYKKRFYDDMNKTHTMLFENCAITPVIYTYPYGAYCEEAEQILSENGYLMTFTCTEGKNFLTKNPDSIRLLKRFNRHGNLTTEDFFERCKIY